MTGRRAIERRVEELEQQLADARREVDFFRQRAEEAGKRSIREIDQLLSNVAERCRFEKRMTYLLDLDRIVNEISTRFLRLPPGELDDGIRWMLERIGIFFGVDRAYLMKRNDHSGKVEYTHEWCMPGIAPHDESAGNITIGRSHDLVTRMRDRQGCVVPGIPAIGDDDPRRVFVEGMDIRISLIVPMFYCDILTGFLGFDLVHRERNWTDEDILTVRTISDIMVNACKRSEMDAERLRLEDQLQIRQRMDSLGTLAGGIAHDFSNLMVGIMGNIELMHLTGDNLTAQQGEFIDEAFSSCRHAVDLIREIQNLSKSRVSEKKSVDIHAVASDVISILNRTTDKLIGKRITFQPGRYYIHANEGQIHQVLLNLGTNAVQAIEERGVSAGDRITISAKEYRVIAHDRTDLPPGDYVHLFFRDTGPGMSDTVRRKAFDPMFTTRRGSQKGQGLGLAMVYNIVSHNHGGYIDIESKEGHGATVHLYLPAAVQPECCCCDGTQDIIGGTETILVIDDEKRVRKFVRESLKMLGYKVITAIDGKRGLEVFRKRHSEIDLVILDLITPRMSGEMALEGIHAADPTARVIVSSGHGDERLGSIEFAHGLLPKPYEIATLAGKVRQVLDSGGQPKASQD